MVSAQLEALTDFWERGGPITVLDHQFFYITLCGRSYGRHHYKTESKNFCWRHQGISSQQRWILGKKICLWIQAAPFIILNLKTLDTCWSIASTLDKSGLHLSLDVVYLRDLMYLTGLKCVCKRRTCLEPNSAAI